MSSPQPAVGQERTDTIDLTSQQKRSAVRRHLGRQLVVELVIPLTAYYGLRAAGVNAWLAMVASAVIIVPILAYGAVRRRHVDALATFTLTMIVAGTVVTLVTGDPRTLLVRDGFMFGAVGLWMLCTLATQRPFIRTVSRTIVTVKIGEEGYRRWDARWEDDAQFRSQLRLLTAVWGAAFTLDAAIRILLAYTLPIDAIVLVSTLQWLAVLACVLIFHNSYVTRKGLKV